MGKNIILPQVRQYVQSMGGKIIGSCGPAVLVRAVEIQPHWIGEILRTYPLEQPAVLAFGRYFALVRRVKPKSVRYLLVGPHSTQSASMMDCYPCWTSHVPEETGREAERNPAVLASLFGRFRTE